MTIKKQSKVNILTKGTDLSQLALLSRLRGMERLFAAITPTPRTASWSRLKPSTLLLSLWALTALLLCALLRQIVNELVERENAEADFVIGRFGAALKQAGEGHSRRWAWRSSRQF